MDATTYVSGSSDMQTDDDDGGVERDRSSAAVFTLDTYINELAVTGDVVLYSGESPTSLLIRVGQTVIEGEPIRWSHVAVVVVVRDEHGRRQVCVFESTGNDGMRDLITGVEKGGPRLINLRASIRHYVRGDTSMSLGELPAAALRRLYVEDRATQEKLEAGRAKLEKFMRHVAPMPYERNLFHLMRAQVAALAILDNGHTIESWFCSELVAECYHRLGLLEDGGAPDKYTPGDFAERTERLFLRSGTRLGPEIPLTL